MPWKWCIVLRCKRASHWRFSWPFLASWQSSADFQTSPASGWWNAWCLWLHGCPSRHAPGCTASKLRKWLDIVHRWHSMLWHPLQRGGSQLQPAWCKQHVCMTPLVKMQNRQMHLEAACANMLQWCSHESTMKWMHGLASNMLFCYFQASTHASTVHQQHVCICFAYCLHANGDANAWIRWRTASYKCWHICIADKKSQFIVKTRTVHNDTKMHMHKQLGSKHTRSIPRQCHMSPPPHTRCARHSTWQTAAGIQRRWLWRLGPRRLVHVQPEWRWILFPHNIYSEVTSEFGNAVNQYHFVCCRHQKMTAMVTVSTSQLSGGRSPWLTCTL